VYRTCILLGLLTLLMVFGPAWIVPWVLGGAGAAALLAVLLLSRLPPPGQAADPERP
jgi:hypothetical protein